jgi:PAS domain S-box-containing protein
MSIPPPPAELGEALRWLAFSDSLLGQSSHDALIAFDRSCHYVYWSERMQRLSGVTPAQALGRSAFEVFPFLQAIGEDAFYRRALAGESPISLARALPARPSAAARLFDVHYSPLKDSGGAIIGGVALVRDVSEKHAAEQQLQETERRFQTMADVAPVLLWMSRTDGMCTFFNQSWLDFTGRTLEQEWGVGWAEGVHFEDLQRCIDTYVDAFNGRRTFEMEYRLRRADGEFRWILDRGTPRYMPDGTFAGFIGSCIDITERKLMEAELRRALRAKDDFLGMVSHELRTPMTALELQLERFKLEGLNALTQRQTDLISRMSRSTERLTALIDSVLQFARIERGRLRAEVKSFDLGALVQSAVEEIRPVAERKGIALRLQVPPDLPTLASDPDLVHLALSNLLSNAIKFTDQGYVEVTLSTVRNLHRIAVRDTGRGIPREEHARVFEPFEQLEPSRQKHTPGVGLGLALVKAMTSALGGEVGLESQPGRGSVFTIALPHS